ncbi:MAG TPA: transglycosylase SLT domain-containing protein [Casimicrobiaceae bacterium]|nr:transglycosylase SLT domain-containing protein [Casimicrobiaceae bacterium]
MSIRTLLTLTGRSATALAMAVGLAMFAGAAAWGQPTDADFAIARDAFHAGDAARLDRIAPRLKGHLLESYVEYWQLRLKLDDADPERVRSFLTRREGGPLADRLRGEWLKSLAKRGQWTLFAAEFPRRSGDDTELACYAIQWQRIRDGDAALDLARPLWFSGQEQPESCQPLFAALLTLGKLTSQDVWMRFRQAHEAGSFRLAVRLLDWLPADERPAQRDLARVERNPAQALGKGDFRWSTKSGRELALYALDRAARSDAASAHDAWTQWRLRVPEPERQYGNLLVAYNAARQLLPSANAWYRDAEGASQDEQQQAWRVRAALRSLAWDDVARAIDAMPEAQAQDPAWRYWKARALSVAGKGEDATRLYGSLATEQHFYGFLAAEALGAAVMPVSEPLPADASALAAFGARDEVQRVIRLTALDLRPEAQREWLYVVRAQDDDTLLLAAEVARRNGLYDRSINTAERTQRRHDFSLRYPTPYRTEIGAAARDYQIDEAWAFGLARQESRFVADIMSAAGAVGLMQLMPATARWVARQIGRADYSASSLDQPELNAQMGNYYLRHVLDRLDGMPVLATAAYNAGPGRAQAWRGAAPMEGAIYAETIPFNETRDYVKKVLANAMFYQAQLGLPYVALRERLGVVTPRGANGALGEVAAIPPGDHRPKDAP